MRWPFDYKIQLHTQSIRDHPAISWVSQDKSSEHQTYQVAVETQQELPRPPIVTAASTLRNLIDGRFSKNCQITQDHSRTGAAEARGMIERRCDALNELVHQLCPVTRFRLTWRQFDALRCIQSLASLILFPRAEDRLRVH